jgi:hypothetical protein
MAFAEGTRGPAGDYPERGSIPGYGTPSPQTAVAVASAALGIGAAAFALLTGHRSPAAQR